MPQTSFVIEPSATIFGRVAIDLKSSIGLSASPDQFAKGIPQMISRDELFFWTPQWQAMERAAEKARAAGGTIVFNDPQAAIRWLMSADEDSAE